METKKKKIIDHHKANQDTLKLTFERILVILEEARQKFDFSSALSAQFELVDRAVHLSSSHGARAWSFPPDNKMSWENPLVAITTFNSYEFNFVFKDGQTSDAPMLVQAGKADQVVKIDPPGSVVTKIVVYYGKSTDGFKLFDA